MPVNNYEAVVKSFSDQEERVSRQITHIEVKQQELQNYIVNLERNNNRLESLIQNEKDPAKKTDYYKIMKSNISMVNELYMTYARYEEIKSKYFTNVSDLVYKKNHLIEVEIRRLDEVSEKYNPADIIKTVESLVSTFQSSKQAILLPELEEEEYQL